MVGLHEVAQVPTEAKERAERLRDDAANGNLTPVDVINRHQIKGVDVATGHEVELCGEHGSPRPCALCFDRRMQAAIGVSDGSLNAVGQPATRYTPDPQPPVVEDQVTGPLDIKIVIPDSAANDAPSRGALDVQVGGGHYKAMKIQPVEYIHANGIAFIEGCVIKYVSRWRSKGGVEDLKKSRHFLDLLIEMEGRA